MGREIYARETRFGRYYEEFELGDTYHHWPGKTITEADDHLFCMITMNHHPLHTDAHYAETETQFGQERRGRQPRLLARARHERAGRLRQGDREPRDRVAAPRAPDVPRRHHLRAHDRARQARVAEQARPRHRHGRDGRLEPARGDRVRVPAARARAEAPAWPAGASVHASIWKFSGDPDDLLARYDAMMSEIGVGNLRLHICLRADDGILMLDAAPSKEAFEAFAARRLRSASCASGTACPSRRGSTTTRCTWPTPAAWPSTARRRRRCAPSKRSVATARRPEVASAPAAADVGSMLTLATLAVVASTLAAGAYLSSAPSGTSRPSAGRSCAPAGRSSRA